MGIAKQGPDEVFVDLGMGDVALHFRVNELGEYCELYMEDLKKFNKVGTPLVSEKQTELASKNKVTLTFPLESPDSLDVLLIRLLEMRQKYYGNVPSTLFRE